MEPGTLGLEGRDLTTAPTPPQNTRFIFQLHKSITYIDGDAFLLYNLQDPPGIFLRLKVNVFQRYLALPYTFALKERFKYLVEFLGLLGSQ